jgi:hypothetical protein
MADGYERAYRSLLASAEANPETKDGRSRFNPASPVRHTSGPVVHIEG